MYMVFTFLAPFLFKRNINIKFLLVSLKTLKNFKNSSENRIKFLFPLSLLALVDFLQFAFMPGLKQFSGGLRNNFGVTGGYQKAGTSYLKRVIGRVFTINKRFYRIK
jgi:hypothetical protein